MRLALEDAEAASHIEALEFTTGREFWKELSGDLTDLDEQADATITFKYPGREPIKVLLRSTPAISDKPGIGSRKSKHFSSQVIRSGL